MDISRIITVIISLARGMVSVRVLILCIHWFPIRSATGHAFAVAYDSHVSLKHLMCHVPMLVKLEAFKLACAITLVLTLDIRRQLTSSLSRGFCWTLR